MGKKICFTFFCLLSLAIFSTGNGLKGQQSNAKLFVFGDSYADTGNSPRSFSKTWKAPYGITYPGKPSGRFSDGRVITDYIASFLRIRSPMPYELKNFNPRLIKYGINFAHGGTGVFPTIIAINQPNMTTQIDFFQQLILKNVYTKEDLRSSVALVSLAGNDYATYLAKNGTFKDIPAFTKSVINQLILNVKRIHDLGIRKIAITGIEPVGCLPKNTASTSYKTCSTTLNNLSQFHNQLLLGNILALNKQTGPVFIYLDIYKAFTYALKLHQIPSGNQLLKPCCAGVHGEDCGFVDKNGIKKYFICKNRKQSFFWDLIHPTNEGWRTVYLALQPSLKYLLY